MGKRRRGTWRSGLVMLDWVFDHFSFSVCLSFFLALIHTLFFNVAAKHIILHGGVGQESARPQFLFSFVAPKPRCCLVLFFLRIL